MARVVEAASETERVIKRKADSSAVARINEHRRRPGNGGVDDCRRPAFENQAPDRFRVKDARRN